MADWVYPEDPGTGAPNGDWTDAANFASAFDGLGLIDYVSDGLSFTYNSGGPSLDISEGKAVVTDASANTQDHSAEGSRGAETRNDGVAYVVEADARSGLTLTASAVNYVYLDIDLSVDDGITYHIDTDDTPPAARPYLKIGEVNTSTDTVTEMNRGPSLTFESARARHGTGFTNAMHHTAYSNGLSGEEIARYELHSDEKLEVYRLECPVKGGGSVNTGITLDVYDETAAAVVQSVNGNEQFRHYEPSSVPSSGVGNSVIVRVSNSTGASVNIAPVWRLALVKSY